MQNKFCNLKTFLFNLNVKFENFPPTRASTSSGCNYTKKLNLQIPVSPVLRTYIRIPFSK